MKVFGLTGGIATGKSTVVEMFRELGARIIDSDLLARQVVEPGREAYHKIVEIFGDDILEPGGAIDREALGVVIFNDPSARRTLNSITHPRVFELMIKGIEDARADGVDVLIVDVPLLFESKADGWIETTILVYSDDATQLKRLMDRDDCDEERALSRINSQMPIDEKKAKADYVIENGGDLEKTRRQVDNLWEEITARRED